MTFQNKHRVGGGYSKTPHSGSKRAKLPGIFKKASSCCHSEIFLKYTKRRFSDKIKEKSLLLWADFSLYILHLLKL